MKQIIIQFTNDSQLSLSEKESISMIVQNEFKSFNYNATTIWSNDCQVFSDDTSIEKINVTDMTFGEFKSYIRNKKLDTILK